MKHLRKLADLPTQRIWDDMTARAIVGSQLNLGVLELDPNGHVPMHEHPNEQIGIIVRGSITWIVGDEREEFGPGGTWNYPAGVPHECIAGPEGAILIEGFAPPRADWQQFELRDPSAPIWP